MNKWYLINENTTPNMIGGFENQAFCDYKNDAFMESLSTDLASTVLLCNYDLTCKKKIRAIIQDNVANTQLKSMERSILVPVGTLHAGDYIFFEDEYWLVNGRPGNNKVYEKATLIECQYFLKWQNATGEIVGRWVNLVSASKYDVGENGNHVVFLTSNNYTIQIPQDEETLELDGKRVFIDLNKKNPRKVFKITRDDDVLYNYNSHGGVLSLIADKAEINLETDNTELMICNYIPIEKKCPFDEEFEIPNESQVLLKIKCTMPTIKVGANYRTFTGVIMDSDENPTTQIGKWSIECDFKNKMEIVESDNQIKIKIADKYNELIGQNFELIFSDVNGTVFERLSVQVESYM